MFGRGFDRERADYPHPLAERHGKRRVGGATADQQYGGVAGRIDIRQCFSRRRVLQPAHHRGMQAPDAQRGAEPRNQTVEIAVRLRERNGVFGQVNAGIDSEQR